MSKLIETYNPQNAKALTGIEIEAMQHFSNEQIEELANAYPNQPRDNNYLVLINTSLPADKQVYQLSTWKNLAALRRLNQKHFSAYSFQSIFNNNKTELPKVGVPLPAQVIDLSKQALSGLPGFKPSEVVTDPIISTDGANPAKLVPTDEASTATDGVGGATDEATAAYDLSNPAIKAAHDQFTEQKSKLDQLIEEKAHHMTVKAQQTKVDEAEAALQTAATSTEQS